MQPYQHLQFFDLFIKPIIVPSTHSFDANCYFTVKTNAIQSKAASLEENHFNSFMQIQICYGLVWAEIKVH